MSSHSTRKAPRLAVSPPGARFVAGDMLDDDERFYNPDHPTLIGCFACPAGHTVGYFGAWLDEPAPACSCGATMVEVSQW